MKIISGGQTGVDRAALDVALSLGLECGGYCPLGRRAEDGIIPEHYPLTELMSPEYPPRTRANVETADATLLLVLGIVGYGSRGSQLTIRLAEMLGKPLLVQDLSRSPSVATVKDWLRVNQVQVLNVAGNRDAYIPAYNFLMDLFHD